LNGEHRWLRLLLFRGRFQSGDPDFNVPNLDRLFRVAEHAVGPPTRGHMPEAFMP